MAIRSIREYDAKRMLAQSLCCLDDRRFTMDPRLVLVGPETDLDTLPEQEPWLLHTELVVKPDELFGKRGQNKLILLNCNWDAAKAWIREHSGRQVTITQTTGETAGILRYFLVEPFVPHAAEYYVGITTGPDYDAIHFSTAGGVNVEEAWDKVVETRVGILDDVGTLHLDLPLEGEKLKMTRIFIDALYRFFREAHLAFLEINPFAIENGHVYMFDVKAKLDDCAAFQCAETWGDIWFPRPFGMPRLPEERRVEELDERTGASLKLTVIHPEGRIWNLVAGGGASVIYADTVADLGLAGELANYGEYSGDPSREHTYEYTKVILDLMTREKDRLGRPKYLLIGGGIANFTDVASTFAGIIQAIEEYQDRLKAVDARIFVRRGGPNYETGLAMMRALGERLGVPIQVYGPETHLTSIVRMVQEG
jgi:ATP-citrate lyase beta-subunit